MFQTVSGSHRIHVGVIDAVTAAFIGGAVVVAALALLTGRSARNRDVHFAILPGSVAKNRHLLDRTVA